MEFEFKPGQVLNFKWSGSLFADLIQLYNKKEYNKEGPTHTAIIGEVLEDWIIVYEATNTGFISRKYGKNELKSYVRTNNLRIGESKFPLTNVKQNCETYLNIPYGHFDILYIGLYFLFGKIAFKLSTGVKSMICSEVVTRVLYDSSIKKIDFEKEYNKAYSFITPIDIDESKQIKWYTKKQVEDNK